MRYSKRKSHQQTIMFRTYILAILILLVTAYGTYRLIVRQSVEPPQTASAELAQCITDSGAKLYGTFWCPHCQRQKELFGEAIQYIAYVECTENGQRNLMSEACKQAEIDSFPTWIFGDGSRYSGEMSLEDIAKRTDCPWGSTEIQAEPIS
ncbi:hypothetical protein KKF05_00935 [Patescibacteria group bacterium]|nr:hypothetical protein [Patescibacteria group bacterium]MBU1029022.1 hypothetical protein [Patescibacteria group bacterium]